jgi:hypothetical protein
MLPEPEERCERPLPCEPASASGGSPCCEPAPLLARRLRGAALSPAGCGSLGSSMAANALPVSERSEPRSDSEDATRSRASRPPSRRSSTRPRTAAASLGLPGSSASATAAGSWARCAAAAAAAWPGAVTSCSSLVPQAAPREATMLRLALAAASGEGGCRAGASCCACCARLPLLKSLDLSLDMPDLPLPCCCSCCCCCTCCCCAPLLAAESSRSLSPATLPAAEPEGSGVAVRSENTPAMPERLLPKPPRMPRPFLLPGRSAAAVAAAAGVGEGAERWEVWEAWEGVTLRAARLGASAGEAARAALEDLDLSRPPSRPALRAGAGAAAAAAAAC